MPSRTRYQIMLVYQSANSLLMSRRLQSQLQRIENEASKSLVYNVQHENMNFQLKPPSIHRINASEWVIHTL